MNEERFKALFEQYLNDSLPSEDLLELREAIRDDRYRELFDDLLKKAFKEPAFAEADDEARQLVFNAISSAINQQENTEPKGNGNRRHANPCKWKKNNFDRCSPWSTGQSSRGKSK
jgi:hypothetical protein